MAEAQVKDYTMTLEQAEQERIIARKKLKTIVKEAEKIREVELRDRAQSSAEEEDDKKILSYETLIEQEKCRAIWRKIKFNLNRGNTEPLTRLLKNEEQGGPEKIITDGATKLYSTTLTISPR